MSFLENCFTNTQLMGEGFFVPPEEWLAQRLFRNNATWQSGAGVVY